MIQVLERIDKSIMENRNYRFSVEIFPKIKLSLYYQFHCLD